MAIASRAAEHTTDCPNEPNDFHQRKDHQRCRRHQYHAGDKHLEPLAAERRWVAARKADDLVEEPHCLSLFDLGF